MLLTKDIFDLFVTVILIFILPTERIAIYILPAISAKLQISADNHFLLKGDVSLQDWSHPQDAYIFGNLSNLYADPEGITFFVQT